MGRVVIEGRINDLFMDEKAVVCSSCRTITAITRNDLKHNNNRLNPYTYTECPICNKQFPCDWITDTYEFGSSSSSKKRGGKIKCFTCGTKFKPSLILVKDSTYSVDEYAPCPLCLRLNGVKTTFYDTDDDD